MGAEQALLRHLRTPQTHASETPSGRSQKGHRPGHRRHPSERQFEGKRVSARVT